MHTITFSLHYEPPRHCFVDTAEETYKALRNMSTQTKERITFWLGLVISLIAIGSAFKSFIYMPPRLDGIEKEVAAQAVKIEAMQLKASATDVAIAGIMPQLAEIRSGVVRIENEVRDQRNKKP